MGLCYGRPMLEQAPPADVLAEQAPTCEPGGGHRIWLFVADQLTTRIFADCSQPGLAELPRERYVVARRGRTSMVGLIQPDGSSELVHHAAAPRGARAALIGHLRPKGMA
jgi:hypothetical protein